MLPATFGCIIWHGAAWGHMHLPSPMLPPPTVHPYTHVHWPTVFVCVESYERILVSNENDSLRELHTKMLDDCSMPPGIWGYPYAFSAQPC